MSNPTRRSPTIAWRIAVRESDLDTTAKAVAYTLSTYMNGRAVAFPSKETLAAGASVSKRAADRAVERLQLAGFLLVAKTKGRTSNRYAAALPTVSAPTGLTVSPPTPLGDANRVPGDTSTLYLVTSNRVNSDTRSSSEIEKEVGRHKLIDDCMKCGEHGSLTDTGSELLCDNCREEST
jgi:hypothetical protein